MPESTPTQYLLRGTIVPVVGDPIADGYVRVEGDRITAVGPAGDLNQASLGGRLPVIDTRGTIYPGLIDLHGHLPYNVLPPWKVPRKYENRDDWKGSKEPDYSRHVSWPMKDLLAHHIAETAVALVRYIEVKLLLGGATTAHGLRCFYSSVVSPSYFAGLVRNPEAQDAHKLARAGSNVDSLTDPKVINSVRDGVTGLGGAFLVHLAEGTDSHARADFSPLDEGGLLGNRLVCIHCLGLTDMQFCRLRAKGAHVVWSPLSNLLLYGQTLDAGAFGGPFSLGTDWSPSGSRNLLQELKVARWHVEEQDIAVSAEALVRSVTINPATALGWQESLGSLTPGKLADLLVIEGKPADPADPYSHLVNATEREVALVVVDGKARHGNPDPMRQLTPEGEWDRIEIGGAHKALWLRDPLAVTDGAPFQTVHDYLAAGLRDLTRPAQVPESLAHAVAQWKARQAQHTAGSLGTTALTTLRRSGGLVYEAAAGKLWLKSGIEPDDMGQGGDFTIDLDMQTDDSGDSGDPGQQRLVTTGNDWRFMRGKGVIAPTPPERLTTIDLAPLTLVDDAGYFTALDQQRNLPKALVDELRKRYPPARPTPEA